MKREQNYKYRKGTKSQKNHNVRNFTHLGFTFFFKIVLGSIWTVFLFNESRYIFSDIVLKTHIPGFSDLNQQNCPVQYNVK